MRKILGKKSFTLIELMFGISILLIVIIVSLGAFINSMLLNESSRNLTIAAQDAQYVLEQIKGQTFANISTFIAGYPSGQFSNLPNESVTFPLTSFSANLATITIQVTWDERNTTRNFSLTSRFAQ